MLFNCKIQGNSLVLFKKKVVHKCLDDLNLLTYLNDFRLLGKENVVILDAGNYIKGKILNVYKMQYWNN